ncbi:MAG: ATP-binding protein [Candidatus Paceibacterota bacterium]
MIENIQKIGLEICEWDSAKFLLFSDNVFSPLIYYSHLFPAILSILFAFFVFLSNPKGALNRLLFLLSITFVLWSLVDLMLWATERVDYIMFAWSSLIYLDVLIYIFTYLFVFYYLFRKELPVSNSVFIFILFLPIIFLAPTALNLTGFDFTNCDREAIEGPLWLYAYLVELLMVGLIVAAGVKSIKNIEDKTKISRNILMCFGALMFLLMFSFGNIFGSFALDWSVAQYGLFGMPVFIGILSYLVGKHGAFNTKILPTQILVFSLWLLTFSLFFLQTLSLVRTIVIVNLALTSILGFFLIRSVKSEVLARQNLQKANDQQQSLMRFINHQVKGFLTRSRLIFDALKNDEYGALTDEARKLVNVGFDTNTQAVQMVKSLLDASNLQDGTVNYQHVNFDFRALVSDIISQLKPTAEAKGLTLNSQIDSSKEMMVNGDLTHLAQAVRNLIENAIQYTGAGAVNVSMSVEDKNVVFKVSDTGLGLSDEDKKVLFQQGGRGEEAQKRNVNSTGYGLFITYKIVKDHNGHVKASSAGRDKGSTFEFKLPLV